MHELEGDMDLFADYLPGLDQEVPQEQPEQPEALLDHDTVKLLAQEPDPDVGQASPAVDLECPVIVEEDTPEAMAMPQEVADGQLAFIELTEAWELEWQDMPAYTKQDQFPWKTLALHFACREHYLAFGKLLGISLTGDTRSTWYPQKAIKSMKYRRFVDEG